jgi:Centromere DNA-binding protein complex CBF3 subunit, domain 2
LGHATVTCSKSRREVQLADLIFDNLENEGPKPDELAPCLIITMKQRKQNQHGDVEYMGCIRNADPILCPLSALAFYFFNRWGKDGALGFPSFRQLEDYLSYPPCALIRSIASFPKEGKGYFLPGAREVPTGALCLKIWPEVDV